MQLEYINPFIESVYELFETMLGCPVERGNPNLVKKNEVTNDLVALIGLSGPVRGTVVLLFPKLTALKMVSRFVGEPCQAIDENVRDAVAELVNIVAGGAKARLSNGDPIIELSLPNVIEGKNCSVHYPSYSVWLDIPFTSELGPFNLRLSFKFEPAA